MKNIQEFAGQFQHEMGWEVDEQSFEGSRASLLNNYMLLTTEVGEVAEELRKMFNLTYRYASEGMDEETAFRLAQDTVRGDIGKELADCLAYITKFANFFEVDLEQSFYQKMDEVKNRKNKDTISATHDYGEGKPEEKKEAVIKEYDPASKNKDNPPILPHGEQDVIVSINE